MTQPTRNVMIPFASLGDSSKETFSIKGRIEHCDRKKFGEKKVREALTYVGIRGRNDDKFVQGAREILRLGTFKFILPNEIKYKFADGNRFPTWELFRERLLVTDGSQGKLGTCWILAGYYAFVHWHSNLLRGMFEETDGGFVVTLFVNGRKTSVTVTNRLPCIKKRLVFASCRRRQLHISIFEKTLASIWDTFQSTEGGFSFEVFSMVTGYPSYYVDIEQGDDFGALWDRLKAYNVKKYPLVGESTEVDKVVHNLRGSHSYIILSLFEAAGRKLVQLQDPWGQSSWTGPWSFTDEDPRNWNPTLRAALEEVDPEAGPGDDPHMGIFFMSWLDFCSQFPKVSFCKIRDDASGYVESRFCGRFPRFGTDMKNMNVFIITVQNGPTKVEVSLHQDSIRKQNNFRQSYHTIGFMILKLEIVQQEYVVKNVELFSGMDFDVLIYAETELDNGIYMFIPLSFSQWPMPQAQVPLARHPHKHFTLAIYSSQEIHVQPKKFKQTELLGDAVLELVYTAKPFRIGDKNDDVWCYSFTDDCSGGLVAVENRSQFPVEISVDATKSKNVKSTRGDIISKDVIPPKSRQLLHIFFPANAKSTDEPEVKHDVSCTKFTGTAYHTPVLGHTACVHSPRPLAV